MAPGSNIDSFQFLLKFIWAITWRLLRIQNWNFQDFHILHMQTPGPNIIKICEGNLGTFGQIDMEWPISILTRITHQKIQCVYIHVYQIIKNWRSGPYNSLRHSDYRKYFSGLSLIQNQREAHMFYLANEEGKILTCSCWEKVTL